MRSFVQTLYYRDSTTRQGLSPSLCFFFDQTHYPNLFAHQTSLPSTQIHERHPSAIEMLPLMKSHTQTPETDRLHHSNFCKHFWYIVFGCSSPSTFYLPLSPSFPLVDPRLIFPIWSSLIRIALLTTWAFRWQYSSNIPRLSTFICHHENQKIKPKTKCRTLPDWMRKSQCPAYWTRWMIVLNTDLTDYQTGYQCQTEYPNQLNTRESSEYPNKPNSECQTNCLPNFIDMIRRNHYQCLSMFTDAARCLCGISFAQKFICPNYELKLWSKTMKMLPAHHYPFCFYGDPGRIATNWPIKRSEYWITLFGHCAPICELLLTANIRLPIFDFSYSTAHVRLLIHDSRRSTTHIRLLTFDWLHSTSDTQRPTFDCGPPHRLPHKLRSHIVVQSPLTWRIDKKYWYNSRFFKITPPINSRP